MFDILSGITKAVVGVVVETPVAIVADVLTLGGSVNDKRGGTYTGDALSKVMDNVEKATK